MCLFCVYFLLDFEHFHIPLLKYGNSKENILYLITAFVIKSTLLEVGEVRRRGLREIFDKSEIYFDYSLRKIHFHLRRT